MRKYSWLLLLLAACNSATENKQNEQTVAPGKEQAPVKKEVSTGKCDRLLFFRKGARVETATFDGSGKETARQHTVITEVKEEKGMTVAYAEATSKKTDGTSSTVSYSYQCDGKSIYFDLASIVHDARPAKDISLQSSSLSYPIDVQPGESLPDFNGELTMGRQGKERRTTFHFRDRKVGPAETVATPAGSWTCYRISHTVEMDLDMPGMSEKAKQMMEAMKDRMKTQSITWFAPDFGIVKMEMYQGGKLVAKEEVISFSR